MARHLSLKVLCLAALCIAAATGRSDAASGPRATPASSAPAASDRAIADSQARLAKNPADPSAEKALAAGFLQKVREVADPAYYTLADKVLAKLGGVKSKDPEVLLLEGTLLLARHQFSAALRVGKLAAAALPSNPSAQGILVDAYNELGRFDESLVATQRMADQRPGLAALSRVSYAREIRGDSNGAIDAMQQAVIAGQGRGENVAYVQTLLGDLLLKRGDVAEASTTYAAATRSFPGLAGALAGEASVLYARGRPAEAAARMAEVVARQPLLQYVIAEGDYYAAAKMAAPSRDAYALVDAIIALSRANGVDIDLEVALYRADHNLTPALIASTRRALTARPGLTGHDSLAWVLHRLGQDREAKTEIAQVIAMGDRDPIYRFHAAAIALGAGDRALASAQLDVLVQGNTRVAGIRPAELAALATALGRTVPPPAP